MQAIDVLPWIASAGAVGFVLGAAYGAWHELRDARARGALRPWAR